MPQVFVQPGPEVIKLEYRLKLKIKHNDWLLVDTCKQPIIALYFEFENELKFPNLKASVQNCICSHLLRLCLIHR